MAVPIQHIIESVHDASRKPERLILLVGRPGSGKSKILRELASMRGWRYVDTRMLITDDILEMVPKARPQQAPNIMGEALSALEGEVILLDGIEVLFTPVLNLDPLPLVKQLSRKHTLVVAWPGDYVEGKLVLDYNGRTHYCSIATDALTVIGIN